MRSKIAFAAVAIALTSCATPGANPEARGLEPLNQPVLTRAAFTYDLSAPGGYLAPEELARLDGWFGSLQLGYGDSVHLDGPYAEAARAQVAQAAGRYGLLLSPAAPVTAGQIPGGVVRVVVARHRAEVPNCPNWSIPAQPNPDNAQQSNFGCAVNSALAAMVANPQDLFYGQDGSGLGDSATSAKAIQYYRTAPPTGKQGLQNVNTKGQ